MSIFVLGGDGYIGWPLSMALSAKYPNQEVVIIDNGTRRRLVGELGSQTITPILSLNERVSEFKNFCRLGQNLLARDVDVASPKIEELFKHFKPEIVFHLAQMGSASYSMKGPEESAFTISNNEIGNIRVIWAMLKYSPGAHLIKLGSFGQYAKCGLEIPEGYFIPECKGQNSFRPLLFPREADDVYHISKINDTNYLAMACRRYGLKVTDIMQSTVFGTNTLISRECEALQTRLDQDEYFGTVVNRFVAQVVSGTPLTVYGNGNQRTGLMSLEDSIDSLLKIAESVPEKGQHRFVNNVTEKGFSVLEIAQAVLNVAAEMNIMGDITCNFNPRLECEEEKADLKISSEFVTKHLSPRNFHEVISESIDVCLKYKHRILESVLHPKYFWP